MARQRNRYPRIPCVVPFCGCGATCYPPGNEIICPKHYRLVDASLKAARRRARHLLKKRGQLNTERAWRLDAAFWRKMKAQAIKRAGGVE